VRKVSLVSLVLLVGVMAICIGCAGLTEKPIKEAPWTGEGPVTPPEPGTKWVFPEESSPAPELEAPATPTPTPTPTPEPDTTPPEISGVDVSRVTESTATIQWETDEAAIWQIEYREDDTWDKVKDLDGKFKTSHNVTLTELETKTSYHFRIWALDESGNEVLSKDYDFTTKTAEELLSPMLYSGITIGGRVHQLSFNLFNGSSQTITVTKVEIFDEHGAVAFTMSKSDIVETWGSGEVDVGQSLSTGISFGIPPSTTEVEDYQVKWYCLDTNGVKFTVKGKYSQI